MKESKTINRIQIIDFLKGVAIILVVVGHSLSYNTSSGEGEQFLARDILYNLIYSFHMPLFFALSGFFLKKYAIEKISMKNKWRAIKSKFIRLMVPYFFIGVAYIVPKIVFSQFARFEYRLSDSWRILIGNNPDGGLWFLYVLFWLSVLAILTVNKVTIYFWLIVGFVAEIVALTVNYEFGNIIVRFMTGMIWLVLGILIGKYYNKIENLSKFVLKLMMLISASVFAVAFIFKTIYEINVLMFVTSLAAIVFFVSMAVLLEKNNIIEKFSAVNKLGMFSMDVYIFHGPLQVIIRTLFWNILGVPYIVVVLLKFTIGLFVSYFGSKWIVRKVKPLFCYWERHKTEFVNIFL